MLRSVQSGCRGLLRCPVHQLPCRLVSTSGEHSQDKLKIESRPPESIKSDWIGPPDPASNLRPYRLYVPEGETRLQGEFRHRREAVHQWNQEYWAKHNRKFDMAKEKYIEDNLKELGKLHKGDGNSKLSAEELSRFYKKFLDENYANHADYNREWYKQNISLLWPAFKVRVERLILRKR